ncbi:MAG: ABC transporter permease [Candidatus Acidiferrales bacterium]
METFWQDVRYGLRMLAKNPGFTAVAVLTLALGIGANTAIFSVVYAVVMKPLPYHQPQQLVRLYSEFPTFPGGGLRRFWISPPEYLDLKRDSKTWQSMEAWAEAAVNIAGITEPIRAPASYVTGGLLDSLGVSPMIGRTISNDDDKPGAPAVALISYGLWKRGFGGDPGIVGHDTTLGGAKCTIIGVMPKDFQFPPGQANPAEVWLPIQIDPAKPGGRGSHFLYLLGRMKPGVTLAQANSEMTQLVRHYGETASPNTHSFRPDRHPIVMYPFQGEVIRTVRPAMMMMLFAVGFVLLIACVNVANLLLARAEVRQRETAIRTALGASFSRLARQFIVEGTVLSLFGAAAGLLLAYGSLNLIVSRNAGMIPRISEVSLNGKVLLFTLLTCIATGIFFGLAPLVQVVTRNLHDSLKSATGRSTATATANWFRRSLVVGEIGLALVLLVGCGLLVRGFWNLLRVNPGYSPHGLLTMNLALTKDVYPDNKSAIAFWTNLEERLSALPGVKTATLVSGLPPERQINANDTDIENLGMGPDKPIQNVDFWQTVGDHYFETMGIALMEGRLFDQRDGDGGPPSAIVNQTMARHFWGNGSPIGKRVRPGANPPGPWLTIVGVVADVKNAGLDRPAGTELYLPYRQMGANGFGLANFSIVLRTNGDPAALSNSASSVIHQADPSLPIAGVRTMDDVLSVAESRPRFLTLLLSLFSTLALALAAVGIYGLMAYSVAQRMQEIGIRMALGAQARDVMRLILGSGMGLTMAGVLLGFVVALVLSRAMTSLLFGVKATDPLTFAAVALLLSTVALLACYVPARRATKIDPLIALRYE